MQLIVFLLLTVSVSNEQYLAGNYDNPYPIFA